MTPGSKVSCDTDVCRETVRQNVSGALALDILAKFTMRCSEVSVTSYRLMSYNNPIWRFGVLHHLRCVVSQVLVRHVWWFDEPYNVLLFDEPSRHLSQTQADLMPDLFMGTDPLHLEEEANVPVFDDAVMWSGLLCEEGTDKPLGILEGSQLTAR